MAATVTTYSLSAFDHRKASEGGLCVMVYKTVEGSITDEPTVGGTPLFMGTGVVEVLSPDDYILTIGSRAYRFKASGACITTGYTDYKLMMGSVGITLSETGSSSATTNGMTRQEDQQGEVIETPSTFETAQPVTVDSLNARDQFAIQALKTLMERADRNPSTMSVNEMNMYCKRAYEWAANMMTEAGFVRIKVDDQTATTETKAVEIGALEGNTEKLLNNLIVELEKTNLKKTEDNREVCYERITIPELKKLIEDYLMENSTMHTFSDLLTKLKEIKDEITAQKGKQEQCLNNIKSSIDTLNTTIGSYLSQLNSTLQTMNTRMQALESQATSIQNGISNIDSNINTIDGNIGSIDSTLDTINGKIDRLTPSSDS